MRSLGPLVLLSATLIAAFAGCRTAVPYQPSREIVSSVPAAMAIDAIRRVIDGQARTLQPHERGPMFGGPTEVDVVVVTIDETEMTLSASGAEHRYIFADLAPTAYVFTTFDSIIVRLTPGDVGGFTALTLQDNDIILLPRAGGAETSEDVETLLDALASLAEAAD